MMTGRMRSIAVLARIAHVAWSSWFHCLRSSPICYKGAPPVRRCPSKDVKMSAGARPASHRPRGSVYLTARLWTHFLSVCFGLNHTALRHHEAAEGPRREPEASDVIVFLYNRGRACKQASMDT
ncbi:hypothetical protein V8D89_016245 [Ganoderma adspersum]